MSKYFYIGKDTTALDLVNLIKLRETCCALTGSYSDLLGRVSNEELCREVCEAYAKEYWGEDIPVQDYYDIHYYYYQRTDTLCILSICNNWGSTVDILIDVINDLLFKQMDNPIAKELTKTINSSVTKTVNTLVSTPTEKPETAKDILSYSFIS